jgi:MinD-like ATPase involved in chromosome partitioning or flagellar assembly
LELPTYTNIWRIEKRLYKLYDFRLPMPLPIGQIAVFAAIAVPYVVVLKVIGLPFSHTLLWLYILPPGALVWLITRPVLEGKRLPELVHSQLRYLNEPRTWCRMAPLAEKEEITVIARVWRRVDVEVADVGVAAVVGAGTAELAGTEMAEAASIEMAEAASIETAEAASTETAEVAGAGTAEAAGSELAAVETAAVETADAETADVGTADVGVFGLGLFDIEIDDVEMYGVETGGGVEASGGVGAGDTEADDVGTAVPSPSAMTAPEALPPAAEARPERSALTRHLPTGFVPAWPKAPARAGRRTPPPAPASPAPGVPGPAARPVPVLPVHETPGEPARAVSAPPTRETPGQAARPVPAPPPARETPSQAARAVPAPPVREAPSQTAPAAPAPTPGRETPSQAAPAPPVRDVPAPPARPVPPASPPPAAPPRSRPVVTVTGSQRAERPIRMVERALGRPAERRTGWHDHVVVVPGGHRPGQPDQMQRDRARARLPIPGGGHRIAVLGCTVGAGQTMTALMTGELLVSLRDDQIAALDLNPGPGSLADRARAVPALTGARPPAPSRLDVVTRETAAHEAGPSGVPDPGEELRDATKIFELLSARYPVTLADPGAAVVPRVLAAASQLILVSPASQDAASALATTREWLEAHGHAALAEGAIVVLNGVSRHTMPYVEQAEAVARGRCRAIVRIPWDDHLKNQESERAPASPSGAHPSRAAAEPLGLATLQAYTALAGVLVSALASEPEPLRARP